MICSAPAVDPLCTASTRQCRSRPSRDFWLVPKSRRASLTLTRAQASVAPVKYIGRLATSKCPRRRWRLRSASAGSRDRCIPTKTWTRTSSPGAPMPITSPAAEHTPAVTIPVIPMAPLSQTQGEQPAILDSNLVPEAQGIANDRCSCWLMPFEANFSCPYLSG